MGLGDLIDAVSQIGDAFKGIGNVVEIVLFGLIDLLPNFLNIFNPVQIVNDTILGIFLSFQILFRNLTSIFRGNSNKKYDKCKNTGSGIFGYRREKNENGNLVKGNNNCKGKKCIKPSLFKIIIAVLCPPLAMFLHFGISGWFHIIISTILTVYFYYFPGLIYVLVHILSVKKNI